MKPKKITILLLIISLGTLFTACKKGEDDPFLSLRSRKARVTGDWTVTSGTATSGFSSPGYFRTSKYTYSETSYSYVRNENGVITTGSGANKITMTFERNGNYRSISSGGSSTTTKEGTWNFTGGVGDAKKKEQIVIHISSNTTTGTTSTSTYTYTGNESDYTLDLIELRNKKMVIRTENSNSSSAGTTDTRMDEYTMERK